MIIEISPQGDLHSQAFEIGDESIRTRDARHCRDTRPMKLSRAKFSGVGLAVEPDQLRHFMMSVKNRRFRARVSSDSLFERAAIERLVAARDNHRVGAAHRSKRFT